MTKIKTTERTLIQSIVREVQARVSPTQEEVEIFMVIAVSEALCKLGVQSEPTLMYAHLERRPGTVDLPGLVAGYAFTAFGNIFNMELDQGWQAILRRSVELDKVTAGLNFTSLHNMNQKKVLQSEIEQCDENFEQNARQLGHEIAAQLKAEMLHQTTPPAQATTRKKSL